MGISVFLIGGAWVKLVLLGIVGIIFVLVALVLCGIHAVYSVSVFMSCDDPF